MSLPASKAIAIDQVPVIDVGAIRSSSVSDRQALARQILHVSQTIGFFYISNHGIKPAQIDKIFAVSKQFFDLPTEAKLDADMSQTIAFRGYIPMSGKGNDARLKKDISEAYQIQADFVDTGTGFPLHAQNLWPKAMPSLKTDMEEYFGAVSGLARELLPVFSLALGFPATSLDRFFLNPLSQLRLIHYPPQDGLSEEGVMGTRAHTDTGCITILAQDNTGGLELSVDGKNWIAVPPIENTFVLNIGEMLKVWSDGVFSATPHRVVNRSGKERYSVPFFLNPDHDAPLQPLVKNTQTKPTPWFESSIPEDKMTVAGDWLNYNWTRIFPSKNKPATV